MSLYLGLMSGTSMDGIDAALLRIEADGMHLHSASTLDWPETLRQRLRRAAEDYDRTGLAEYGALDTLVGEQFALAATRLLRDSGIERGEIRAIGSHGQTLLHQPHAAAPFTLQVGDPNLIAERTGIDVVADFRRRDVAAGGEGAPLMPAFHAAAFAAAGETRALANIGGLANVTVLTGEGGTLGFDTGPGNCLLDAWTRRHQDAPYDRNGAWAATGHVNTALLERLLQEPYFNRPAPKSTGRETFSDGWLDGRLQGLALTPVDVQATLAQLTAQTIAMAVQPADAVRRIQRLLVCGGGAANADLMRRLAAALPGVPVQSTTEHGIAADHVEAAGFAWLAYRYLAGLPGNIPAVTGARRPVPLGALYRGQAL